MTYAEIKTMVASIGLPYAYYQWHDDDPEKPAGPPFVCFYYERGGDFYADGKNYVRIKELVIEHYADNPDFVTDDAIVELLNANGLSCVADEPEFIRDQRMWVTRIRAGLNVEPIPISQTEQPATEAGNDNQITPEEENTDG